MVPPQSLKLKHRSDTRVLINGVPISLKEGDITKETVDLIVNSTNKSLDLNTGVSGAILKAAGQSVVDECKKQAPLKAGAAVLTGAGALQCKYIAQMVGPDSTADITSSLEKVLNLCEAKTARTLAIPAIGTGRGGFAPKESIKAILTAIEKHLKEPNSSCLRSITIVAFEQKTFDDFQCQKYPCPSGVSGAIFKAAGASVEQECQKHGPLQNDIAAVTSGGNLHCNFIVHMVGPHSAAEVRSRVKNVLERCEEKQITTVSFPAVGTGAGGVEGEDAIGAMLQGFEDHLAQNILTVIKLIYVVIDQDNVLQEFQKETVLSVTLLVCFLAIIHPPPTWTKMDGRDLEIITLQSDSVEYKNIKTAFLRSSIHRDVNQSQWQRYCVLKQAVDKKYPKQRNERLLYHGTTKEICQKINKNGFNRSFCGRNAVVHGEGTYFAREAWYSCQDQYSNPDDKQLKYIYRARVVTGSLCKSREGMKEPDPINAADPRAGLHDCAVDDPKNPFIFVVFCDAGAYPEYLITFKSIVLKSP
uniref:Poly [ADP-ribose] polymerase n=1 Tax=Cyprinus carpio carpio TaxID=630221 RepID=A0A8C1DTF2_CYPCA